MPRQSGTPGDSQQGEPSEDDIWAAAQKARSEGGSTEDETSAQAGAAGDGGAGGNEGKADGQGTGGTQDGTDSGSADGNADANLEAALAALPPETQALIKSIRDESARTKAALDKFSSSVDKISGTVGNLKQRLDETHQRVKPVIEGAEKAAQEAAVAARKAAKEKRQALRERLSELPDLIEYLDVVLPPEADDDAGQPAGADAGAAGGGDAGKATQQGTQQQGGGGDGQGTQRGTGEPTAAEIAVEQRILAAYHPDWTTVRDTPEFKAWWKNAPTDIKAKYTWKAEDTAQIFDAYKEHRKAAGTIDELENERDERLRRGGVPPGRKGGGAGPDAGIPAGGDALWNRVKRDRAAAQAD